MAKPEKLQRTSPSIRILESDNNKRGDLFGALMSDLFIALGYEQPRLNIHKSGRELDLSATHRLEPRRAIAECKATLDPVGGGDLNKFYGVLDIEASDKKKQNHGYFISLNGFTETAREQELSRRTKIILLTGAQVVEELIKGRSLITRDQATDRAAQCRAHLNELELDSDAELLAHARGWVWAIYYTQGKSRTHFVLIHADGTTLARPVAEELVAADSRVSGTLHRLQCLNPGPLHSSDDEAMATALGAYRKYLDQECGAIHLDGLPTDNEIGSRRLRLEQLFIPLHLDQIRIEEVPNEPMGKEEQLRFSGAYFDQPPTREIRHVDRRSIGTVMSESSRLALLSPPGGGKSTLLKRLAVAYADPIRKGQIRDNLPDSNWIPLFFRCRELRHLARGSFSDLLGYLCEREAVRGSSVALRELIDRSLLAGNILLLIDGLDEISDPGDRASFACTLRTTLQAYPNIAMVVTSREAGFRHVAPHFAPICKQATISTFSAEDIRDLTVAWHREVAGDTAEVRNSAELLAQKISENDRIRRVAVNPLLLTTLLLVKRWVGSLPTRRVVLYGKAIEVLLTTWNTEGHDPMPLEETIPQLCYVASAMMLKGEQKISRPRLSILINQARKSLPTELGYVKDTVEAFISRVEHRSSLLMMTGVDIEDGQLVEFFEFRHLTFQEFLTARGMVEGWHPNRKDSDTLAFVLLPFAGASAWNEIIPLAAALGGRAAEGLIQGLTERAAQYPYSWSQTYAHNPLARLLLACLADEVAVKPQTVHLALTQIVRFGRVLHSTDGRSLARGRHGEELLAEAGRATLEAATDWGETITALAETAWARLPEEDEGKPSTEALSSLANMCSSENVLTRSTGFLSLGRYFQEIGHVVDRLPTDSRPTVDLASAELVKSAVLLLDGTPLECLSAAWCLGQIGRLRWWIPKPEVITKLIDLWLNSTTEFVRNVAQVAFDNQPPVPREQIEVQPTIPTTKLLGMSNSGSTDQLSALVAIWYLRLRPDLDIAELAAPIKERQGATDHNRVLRELRVRLGLPQTNA